MHWAFEPISDRLSPPIVAQANINSAIDAFLLNRLRTANANFAQPASKLDWLRRITLDTIGLPPTPEQIDAYLSDDAPDADARIVDRLLASPQYGPKMAQMWLDVVRYAETEGYEYDRTIPDAWRYRDWVIDAFNVDKPFNVFAAEQIAGDEVSTADHSGRVAAIFHRLGPVRRNAGNPDIALSRNEVLTERTDIIGSAFLGLSLGCARCHNHKLEPISQRDYYQLQAYLAATEEDNIVLASREDRLAWESQTEQIKAKIKELTQSSKQVTGDAKDQILKQIESLEQRLPPALPTIPTIRNDHPNRTVIHILRRGVWEHKGQAVAPRPLTLLSKFFRDETTPESLTPRTELVRWLCAEENPLFSRVIVNRIWQMHFGMGIVKTTNDFGTHGDRPSHPELLDWLASELKASQWQLKRLHREILLSTAYRQAVENASPTASVMTQQDPENRLLSHFTRRRLSGEEIRDAMLLVSGCLNGRLSGPSVLLPADPELVNLLYKPSQWVVTEDREQHGCRSIFLFAKRNLRLPMMETLDAPPLLCSCPKRETSTHAPQALELMNGWQSNTLAYFFADRLERESSGAGPTLLIRNAFRSALGRFPHDDEQKACEQFLGHQSTRELALALFNLNEFLYVR